MRPQTLSAFNTDTCSIYNSLALKKQFWTGSSFSTPDSGFFPKRQQPPRRNLLPPEQAKQDLQGGEKERPRALACAGACVFLAGPVCLLQPQRRNTPASRVARNYSLGSDDYRILPGMHHGRMSCGWIRRFMWLNIHSRTPRHHIQNSHLPHMSTRLRVLVYHTPVGQENSTLTPIILVFISDLMNPGGFWILSLPHIFFLTRRNSRKSLLPLIVYVSAEINNYAI